MDDAAKHIVAVHWPGSFAVYLWDGNGLLNALMRACRVEEFDVVTHGANPALCKGISIRREKRCQMPR